MAVVAFGFFLVCAAVAFRFSLSGLVPAGCALYFAGRLTTEAINRKS